MSIQPYLVSRGTSRGPQREQNEDHLGTPPEWIEPAVLEKKGRLYIVADGMGGHVAGQDASRRAVSRVFHEYYADPSTDIASSLERAIALANSEIYQVSQQNPAFSGMGTTLTAAVVHGNELHIAHVGDSRAYVVRRGTAHQLTEDHSLVAEQVRQGTLTPEQARTSPYRNVITRSLGAHPTVQVDHLDYKLQPGDRIVLCTDGLSNVVDGPDLAQVVAGYPDVSQVAEELLKLADKRGRSDDATVLVIGMPEPMPGASRRPAAGRKPVRKPKPAPVIPIIALASLIIASGVYLSRCIPPPPQPTPTPVATTVTTSSEVALASPSAMLAPTATAIPTATPAPTKTPTTPVPKTPTPTLAPAPQLAFPVNEANVTECDQLKWAWTRQLKENEYFDVRIWKEGQPHYGIGWTKDPWFTLGKMVSGKYFWSIAVIRHTGTNPDGTKEWVAVSEESEVRWFFYYSPPQLTPTPEPINTPENTPIPTR